MTGGYTPLFESLSTGTLCGKWPDIGLWPIVLSLADRYGLVDVTPTYISHITGLGVDDVVACMKRFIEPDPYSRSSEEHGARLVLHDPENRDWGWRIVNHSKYREKARKSSFDAARSADGRNANRMAGRRTETREDPRRPAETRAHPPSDSDSDSKNIGQSDFDRFWAAYPKKVKRKNSEQIWKRKKLDAKIDLLLSDVANRIKNDRQWLEGYVPDPSTYLNGDRWNDDVQGASPKPRGFAA